MLHLLLLPGNMGIWSFTAQYRLSWASAVHVLSANLGGQEKDMQESPAGMICEENYVASSRTLDGQSGHLNSYVKEP